MRAVVVGERLLWRTWAMRVSDRLGPLLEFN